MLSKVIEYLKNKGDTNVSTISRKLDIEEGTVEMLLDQLVKLGYLEVISQENDLETECTPLKCKGCSKATECKPLLKVKYKLTEKGQ